MLHANQTPKRCELSTAKLRMVCELEQDRWRHTISIFSDGDWRDVLTSVEGTPEQPCPASPAFQELLLEEKSPQLMEVQLFGRSGGCLYAAAVAVDEARETIDVDVSARFRGGELPETVGSTYAGGDWHLAGEGHDMAVQINAQLRLAVIGAAEKPACGIRSGADGTLEIGYRNLSAASSSTGGTTLRWHYRISYGQLS